MVGVRGCQTSVLMTRYRCSVRHDLDHRNSDLLDCTGFLKSLYSHRQLYNVKQRTRTLAIIAGTPRVGTSMKQESARLLRGTRIWSVVCSHFLQRFKVALGPTTSDS